MVSVTSEKTVGLMKSPLSSMAEPPYSSLAPSFFPLSIRSRILLNCFWSICKTVRGKPGFLLGGDYQLMCPTASYVITVLPIMFWPRKNSWTRCSLYANIPPMHKSGLFGAGERWAFLILSRCRFIHTPSMLLSKSVGETRSEVVKFFVLTLASF